MSNAAESFLQEGQLLQAAAAQVPDTDFGPGEFLPAFRLFLEGLSQQANLSQQGVWATVARIVQSLKRRRQLAKLLERDPSVRDIKIEAPVFVVGFPRTGTTMMHNLLAADPNNRAIRLWEMREPFAPEGATDAWVQETLEMTQQLVEAAYQMSPKLANIHPLRAEWPDECSWLFRNSFATLVHSFSYYLPDYTNWMIERDMTEDYAYFRLQLQAILSQRPGQPLVLKDPCHTWHLEALIRVFPDARLIFPHRKIESVVGSFASLCQALQESSCEDRPPEEIGAYTTTMLERGMRRLLQARKHLPSSQCFDLAYSDLVAAPLDMMERVYQYFGLPWSEATRSGMQAWMDGSKKLTGRHAYDLSSFGLTKEDIDQRFEPYTSGFSEYLPK